MTVIVGIAVIGVALMFGKGSAWVLATGADRVAAGLAQQRIEQIRACGWDVATADLEVPNAPNCPGLPGAPPLPTGLGVLLPDPDIQAGNNHTFTRRVCIQYVTSTSIRRREGTGGAAVHASDCPPGDPTSMVRVTVVVESTSSDQPETSPSHPAGLDEPGGPMTDQRGLSLVELLVAALLTTVVAGGLFSAYMATTRSFGESSAQAALQRQGTLVLEEIGRQVRGAVEPNARDLRWERRLYRARARRSVLACSQRRHVQWPPRFAAGENGGETAAGDICYYARADGALCETRGTTVAICSRVASRPSRSCSSPLPCPTRDARPALPPAPRCFRMAPVDALGPPTQVDLAFAIRDSDGDLDGVNVMAFSISLTCSGRNC